MELIQIFGKMGYSLYRKVRGIHNSPVQVTRERKSVGRERTYGKALTSEQECLSQLRIMAEQVTESLKKRAKAWKDSCIKITLF